MLNKAYFLVLVLVHYIIFFSFVTCILLAWRDLPWYAYLTLTALIVRIMVSRDKCPLTLLENKYRARLKMRASTGFLKDWVIRPFYCLIGKTNA